MGEWTLEYVGRNGWGRGLLDGICAGWVVALRRFCSFRSWKYLVVK